MIDLARHGYTHQQVLDLLSAPDGVRNVSYRIDVLRRGVKVRKLDYTKCTYDCNYLSDVKYSATVYAKDDPMINWRTDFLRPAMTLHANGLDFDYTFTPLKCVTPACEIRNGVVGKRIEAYDESIILKNNSLGDQLFLPAGTSYVAAVESLIGRAGFTNVNIIPSTKKLANDREDWTIDAFILDVANDLLEEINYRSLEMGRDGILTAYEYSEPSVADANIHYRADGKSVIINDKEIEHDDFRRYNRFIGYAFNANMDKALRYEFLNDSPASPISPINNGGYIITATREYNDVADYETLVSNVRRWADETAQSYEHVNMDTAIMPHHEVREIITVESQGANGVYVETAWGFDNFGSGGKMSHELRKVVYE